MILYAHQYNGQIIEALFEIETFDTTSCFSCDTEEMEMFRIIKNISSLSMFEINMSKNADSVSPPTAIKLQQDQNVNVNKTQYDNGIVNDTCFLLPSIPLNFTVEGHFLDAYGFCIKKNETSKSCEACIPGYQFSLRGKCEACVSGKYKKTYGNHECVSCDSGKSTFSLKGQTSCLMCHPGSYSKENESSSQCILCPKSKYQPNYSSSQCLDCPEHSETDLNGSVHPKQCICTQGYHMNTNPEKLDEMYCKACSPGFFQSYSNATYCETCKGLRTNSEFGSSSCDLCIPGSSIDAYGKDCIACPEGTYNDAIGKNCMPCHFGFYQNQSFSTFCYECQFKGFTTLKMASTNENECVCPPGYFIDSKNVSCKPCPIGFFQQYANQFECLACKTPYSSTFKEGSIDCLNCQPGSVLFKTSSIENSSMISECRPCRPGFYQSIQESTKICLPCPLGTFSKYMGSTYCQECYVNYFTEEEGAEECMPCPDFSNTNKTGASSCSCSPGSVIGENNVCIPCKKGLYQRFIGQPCIPCPAGSYSNIEGKYGGCELCANGKFTNVTGSHVCFICPNYSTNYKQGSTSCTCLPGFSKDAFNMDCLPCLPGFYSNDETNFECKACAVGKFNNISTGQTECVQCFEQSIALSMASTSCEICTNGSISNQERSKCVCIEGITFNQSNTLGWNCIPCSKECFNGSFMVDICKENRDITCNECSKQCPAGKYKIQECTLTQNIVCTPCSISCSIDHFMKVPCTSNEDMKCEPCKKKCPSDQGYYMEYACRFELDAVCTKCPAGSYPDPLTNAFCIKCGRGHVVSLEKGKCEPCLGLVSANKSTCITGNSCPPNEYPFDESSCAKCPSMTRGTDGLRCESCIDFDDCQEVNEEDLDQGYRTYEMEVKTTCKN